MLKSKLCDRNDFEAGWFREACRRVSIPFEYSCKVWEFCCIYQALFERGLLAPGKKGLGFGVGKEPLASVFASHGCKITATDLDTERARELGWVKTDQHSRTVDDLNEKGICDLETFRGLVTFEHADMNDISDRYDGRYDFTWSSCSLEHLGSLEAGKRFLLQQMNCLKPGGLAVHTTFYNLSSNNLTIERNPSTVIFRKKDIEDIVSSLRDKGCSVEIDYTPHVSALGSHTDVPPYTELNSLVVRLAEYDCTSINLIISKGPDAKRFDYTEKNQAFQKDFLTGTLKRSINTKALSRQSLLSNLWQVAFIRSTGKKRVFRNCEEDHGNG